MMSLMEEKAEAKKKLILAVITVVITLLAGLTIILLSGLLEMEMWLRVVLGVIGVVIIGTGIGLACVLDRDAGVYECKYCGEQFVPTMKAYVFGAHTPTRRKLRCPKCGKKSYCKKRLAKTE